MIFVSWEQLDERAVQRPEGYREFVLSHALQAGADGFILPEGALEQIRQKFSLSIKSDSAPCVGCGG